MSERITLGDLEAAATTGRDPMKEETQRVTLGDLEAASFTGQDPFAPSKPHKWWAPLLGYGIVFGFAALLTYGAQVVKH